MYTILKPILAFILLLNFYLISLQSFSQEQKTSQGAGVEFIFSSSNFDDPDFETNPVIRFTGFFNWRHELHYNFTKHSGLITGLGIRNIGLINKFEDDNSGEKHKMKQRSYTLGLPLALKFGNIDNTSYLYLGGEIELAFAYKEKMFKGGEKQYKRTAWFSDKTNRFLPSVFVGYQFSTGINISAKYYLVDFLNTSYREDGIAIYEGTQSNIFYVSLGIILHNSMMESHSQSTHDTQTTGL